MLEKNNSKEAGENYPYSYKIHIFINYFFPCEISISSIGHFFYFLLQSIILVPAVLRCVGNFGIKMRIHLHLFVLRLDEKKHVSARRDTQNTYWNIPLVPSAAKKLLAKLQRRQTFLVVTRACVGKACSASSLQLTTFAVVLSTNVEACAMHTRGVPWWRAATLGRGGGGRWRKGERM